MKGSTETYSIDANVILRYLLRDVEKQWARAETAMRAMQAREVRLVCDPVNLAEVVWVLDSIYELDREEICMALESLLKADCFVVPDKDRYIRAVELYRTTAADFGDACACARALESCDGKLLTFDKKLSRIEGVARLEEVG